MPLFAPKVLAELERKRDRFTGYSDRFSRQLDAYRALLERLGERFPDTASLERGLRSDASSDSSARGAVGALPTREYDAWRARAGGGRGIPALPFGRAFAHHEEAREWAELLRGVTTLAVDGSQLMPWRDASVPIALVQAGIFENPHQPPAPYLKDVVTEVLTPEELMGAQADTADARTGEVLGYSERAVHLRRFQLEIETLIARMEHHAEHHAERRDQHDATAPSVVAFYDGSLIVSFARTFQSPLRERYIELANRLLAASERCRVPVVGYIDTSYARDLLAMLRALSAAMPDQSEEPLPEPHGLHDALLFAGRLGWGDRTPAFLSARGDLARPDAADPMGEHDGIAFVYFQAALDRPPARIELPRWVLEAGQLDAVMDVVLAETIVGNGYPAPIEAADAVAVISTHDRAQFYALFQDWVAREGLPFTFSRKALSKSRRRV
jgi:hypothetical protein